VADQVDWPHVVDEIEHSRAQRPDDRDEIARLTARLIAAETLVNELRSRLDELSSQLGATKAELATAQGEVETATARAVTAAEAEQALRQADAKRRTRGRWATGSGRHGGANNPDAFTCPSRMLFRGPPGQGTERGYPAVFSLAVRPKAMPLGLPGAKSREVTRSSSCSALSKSSHAAMGSARANAS
jgi:septal ring factor EnvC (AmiA/AmiB activator)